MKAITRNIYLIAGVVVIAAVLVIMYFFNQEHPDLLEKDPDFIMKAEELYAEFEKDEQAANEKYTGKIVQVSGTVSIVETEQDSSATISLMGENEFAGVLCSFQEPAKNILALEKGEKVSIRGICSGFLMDVLLNQCVVVDQQE